MLVNSISYIKKIREWDCNIQISNKWIKWIFLLIVVFIQRTCDMNKMICKDKGNLFLLDLAVMQWPCDMDKMFCKDKNNLLVGYPSHTIGLWHMLNVL